MPDIGRSIVEEHQGANTTRIDFNPFLKGRRTPVSVEHNMRSGQVTLDVAGKPKNSWQAKSFAEAFAVQYNFTHEGLKFSLRMGVDSDGNETESLELEIEGVPYNKYPFIDIKFGKFSWQICSYDY